MLTIFLVSFILVIVLFHVLYHFVFRGILSQINERKKAEDKLRKFQVNLEMKIEERTEDLNRANKQLKQEIDDRKKTNSL
jgi:C4-dicarboxylate-specific signal transduction histidine kinase